VWDSVREFGIREQMFSFRDCSKRVHGAVETPTMPKDDRSRRPKGPLSRPPLRMPVVGAIPKGTSLWVGRGGQWVIGTVVRWSGEADDSSHWYELAFEAAGGASEWHDLAPARRAIGTAVGGSWSFPADEDISLCSAGVRRCGGGGGRAVEQAEPRTRADDGAGRAGVEQTRVRVCPHCAATFTQSSGMRRHVRIVHEKRRDHACPHCDAAFGDASKLTVHVRAVHEKRRDHACPHCDAAFGQASDVRMVAAVASACPAAQRHLVATTVRLAQVAKAFAYDYERGARAPTVAKHENVRLQLWALHGRQAEGPAKVAVARECERLGNEMDAAWRRAPEAERRTLMALNSATRCGLWLRNPLTAVLAIAVSVIPALLRTVLFIGGLRQTRTRVL
jgi:hypothetical protein